MRRCPAAEAWQEWDLKPARRSGVLVERVRPGGAGVLEEKTIHCRPGLVRDTMWDALWI